MEQNHNHNHDHSPGHNHSHEPPASLKNLIFAHIKSGEESPDHETIIRAAQEMLLHKYGINHTTLQILPFSAGEMEHCNHCN